jgi:hypothetical protein
MSTYTPLSSQTLTANTASVTFSGIPQNYTDLVLVMSGGMNTTTGYAMSVRLNGDTGSNYSATYINGDGTTASSGRYSTQTAMYLGAPARNTLNGNFIFHFQNYSNTVTNKSVLARSNSAALSTWASVGLWRNTAAINSIQLFPEIASWLSGTTFTLYGIGSGSPKAFGGDIVTTDGTYWYHTFNTSGVFSPVTNLSCDYLVVAGGGGGGSTQNNSLRGAGGGGAGGFLTATGFSVTLGSNLTVTVGAGGVGGASNTYANGTSGSDSVFSTITSSGGGFGAQGRSDANRPGGSGGSGGGGGNTSDGFTAIGGTGTSGQGNNGGNGGVSASGGAGGSGGGAGGAGGNGGTGSGAGNITGGAGSASSITGSSITYAIGGRGGGYNATPVAGPNGTANLGEGGGGRSGGSATAAGGNGGSGIVIVRYLV